MNMTGLYADVLPEMNGKLANTILDYEKLQDSLYRDKCLNDGKGEEKSLQNTDKRVDLLPNFFAYQFILFRVGHFFMFYRR